MTSPNWTGNDLDQSETCSHDSHAMARLPLFLFPLLSTNDKKLLLWLWQSGDVARVVPQLLITCYVFNDNFLLFKQQKVKISSFWFFFQKKGQKRTMTTFRDTFLQPALNDRSFKRKAYFLLQETALCFYHICKNGVSTSSRLQCSPTCVVAYICSGIVGQSMI